MQKLHKPNKSVTNVRMGRTRWRRAAPFYLSEMAESRKMMKYNTEKIRKAVHDELLCQIEGLLNYYYRTVCRSNLDKIKLHISNYYKNAKLDYCNSLESIGFRTKKIAYCNEAYKETNYKAIAYLLNLRIDII